MSRAGNSVKHWRNLPISNPKPDFLPYQCMCQVWLKSLDIYSSYRPGTKIWTCLGQITLSKFDKICLLAIQHQISAISMHIPNLWKSTDVYSNYHLETKYGQTYDWLTDGWHTDIQRETIIPRHYHVAGYKNIGINISNLIFFFF